MNHEKVKRIALTVKLDMESWRILREEKKRWGISYQAAIDQAIQFQFPLEDPVVERFITALSEKSKFNRKQICTLLILNGYKLLRADAERRDRKFKKPVPKKNQTKH